MLFLDKEFFNKFAGIVYGQLLKGEILTLSLSAEDTLFVRVNSNKVRQISHVCQGLLNICFYQNNKSMSSYVYLSGILDNDVLLLKKEIEISREILKGLPDDPFIVFPQNLGASEYESLPKIPSEAEIVELALSQSGQLDLAGLITRGVIVRANSNSLGQLHWFKTQNFYVDYSIYNHKQNAVKNLYAGQNWNANSFKDNLNASIKKLKIMDKETKTVPRGQYKVYLEPAAVDDILSILNWEGLSMGAHKRGKGSLKDLWEGNKKLSPLFTLTEDFNLSLRHRFNELGELADMKMPVIERGELKNLFTSNRTAKEFQIPSNKASSFEGMRSPVIETGTLKREEILSKLGTGLYISNLHYLNWSDRQSARITGMTRYACFWVENGEIQAPIKDLRFDESIYHVFGSGLLEITEFSEILPNTGSYEQRDVGGAKIPGMLIKDFTFTL